MKAIRVQDYGEPEVLVAEEVPNLVAGPGQVVVEVRAAGVNPVETYRRAGTPPYNNAQFPYTPGSDGAGVIASVGDADGDWKVGDRVFITRSASGTYAQFALCGSREIYSLPDNISFEQGAAVGVPYATAHRALFGRAGAKAGESVFIHGASGGVGIAAVQLAKAAGLKVGGSAGGPQGEAFLESLGLRYTADHRAPNYLSDVLGMTCGAGFDIILEMAANINLGHDPQVLARFGRIVVVGNRGLVEVNPREWMTREATVYGMSIMNLTAVQLEAIYTELVAGLKNGTLQPLVAQTFALAEAPAAHRAVLESGKQGKIVLVP